MATDDKLLAEARAFVDEVWEDVVSDIDYLVQVESVEDKGHATDGAPFGPGPREALGRALQIASRLGLKTHDCDGYLGYANLAGRQETPYLATIAHSDIVPVGTGWTFDPLRVTRKDGYLLGRGVLDDKGPLVLSLYAANFFARKVERTKEPLPYTLRCIVGANEETGMADVDYYLEHFEEPAFCFSPDAVYPVICGEKGLFHATIQSDRMGDPDSRIVRMDGGSVPNAVADTASAVVRAALDELPSAQGIELGTCGQDASGADLCTIVAHGKGGHAAMPEGTRNAIGMLVDYLVDAGLCSEQELRFLCFEQRLLADTDGQALGIAATDDVFDPLTCVGGTLHTHDDDTGCRFVQTMDVRYPKSTTGQAILDRVQEVAAAYGCSIVAHEDVVPFYIDPKSDEIQVLARTYNEIAGQADEPITIGGGTYARHFRRAAAFGPDDPHTPAPSWVGAEHGPDEGVAEATLRRALVIYIVSIARLMRLELA